MYSWYKHQPTVLFVGPENVKESRTQATGVKYSNDDEYIPADDAGVQDDKYAMIDSIVMEICSVATANTQTEQSTILGGT